MGNQCRRHPCATCHSERASPKKATQLLARSLGTALAEQEPIHCCRDSRCVPHDSPTLSNLNHAFSAQESLLDARPQAVEGLDQGGCAAIAQAHPEQTCGAFGVDGEVDDVSRLPLDSVILPIRNGPAFGINQPEGCFDARAYITVIYELDGRIPRKTRALLRLRLGCR